MLNHFVVLFSLLSIVFASCTNPPACKFQLCYYDEEKECALTKAPVGAPILVSGSGTVHPYFVCPTDMSVILKGKIQTSEALAQGVASPAPKPISKFKVKPKFKKNYFTVGARNTYGTGGFGVLRGNSKKNQNMVLQDACVTIPFKKYQTEDPSGKKKSLKFGGAPSDCISFFAKTFALVIELEWEETAKGFSNLDLELVEPAGETISRTNPVSDAQGNLSGDAGKCGCGHPSNAHESVAYFDKSMIMKGLYEVRVVPRTCCVEGGSSKFIIRVSVNGNTKWTFEGNAFKNVEKFFFDLKKI